MTELVLGMGLIALVLTVSALVSGIVERAPLSFPMIFLGIGFLLGGGGLGIIEMDSHNPVLEAVATISLALVLFLDAVKFQIKELREDWYIPFLTLGPGTMLVIGGIALAAYALVGTTPVQSLLLGAILASTDPVVLRDITRDERIPRSVRRTLGVEAGMSDVIVLPIVLILIAVLNGQLGGIADWAGFIVRILVLSPLVGLAVGGLGARLMVVVDRRYHIRLEYQALYGIGLVLAAYFSGTMINGDGFLSAFFAGLAVTLFNTTLCNCFLEYGEVTSEMMMLLAFVLFGAVLSTILGTVALIPAVVLAVVGIGIIRPAAFGLVLQRARMSNAARLFMGWFGPRGLDSMLLALLVVQAGVPGADHLLAVTGVVVVISVVVHGASATPISAWYGRRVAAAQLTMAEERESTFVGLFEQDADGFVRIKPEQLAAMLESDQPPLVLDVRSRAHYERDEGQIPGSIRVLPDQIREWGDEQDKSRAVIAYCTCPDEASSGRVARQLTAMGFDARALEGGFTAWHERYPVEPKGAVTIPAAEILA